ncbi:NADH-quinone oxidoreductase subunit NuoK [Arcanobacterium sp. S3PF19]|uniref:NADH-quinone oxidoreductase subunit NuoK n=1 Tax=Arcanobacterium sp. S3PF19 TaxID=1219585 RepID=UPI0005104880|nr:NADH-quinone oxidoreductase subunit NuoK [Arcanobacterium sp. S3PF19]KGF06274.1 NADH:ubiquinone oxidoreductase subunit K [Arcanobacterium sp. S3PF19]
MNPIWYVILALVLFAIGGAAVLIRRNAVIALLGVEMMLNSCNLVFVTFSRIWGNLEGQVFSFFVMVVAAAEVVVGLAIVISIFQSRRSSSLDRANLMKN